MIWPLDTFSAVPQLSEAIRLAEAARSSSHGTRADLIACCLAADVRLEEAPLRSAQGGCEAMLVPLKGGGFRAVVDRALTPEAAGPSVARQRRRFRVAHELGHTFFYTRSGGRPRRLPATCTLAEEEFCDEFARRLLAPSPRQRLTALGVLGFQVRHDVSLEVAARAVAAGPQRQRIGLWWWPTAALVDDRVSEQWVSDAMLREEVGLTPCGATSGALRGRLAAAQEALGERLSARLLPARRQLLAVLD